MILSHLSTYFNALEVLPVAKSVSDSHAVIRHWLTVMRVPSDIVIDLLVT